MSEAEIITGARAFLRANLTGTIGFDEEFIPIKVVVAPDGALVAPVMVAMLRALDVVIFLPAEDDAAMQLQVTLEEIQDSGEHAALCDRWRIYHGEPEDVRWARISIDAAKFDGRMFDGLALMEPNALADAEPRICRKVNAEMRGLLKQACLRVAEVEIEDPRLVGVDPLGFDIRGRFDVVRLDVDPEIVDDADAFAALEELAADTGADGDASNT
jgi:DNA-binding protein YbaB